MSEYKVKKGSLAGDILIPSSKSHTLRAILFASLALGKSVISKYLDSSDTHSMIKACRSMGAKIDATKEQLFIEGINGQIGPFEDVIDAGNSGLVFRFLTALGSLSPFPIVVTGDHSIRHARPIKPLLDALNTLGVTTKTVRDDGYAPVIVQGPWIHHKTKVEGTDSQPVSALLIAAAFAKGPTEIEVINTGEKPWIALTLDWLDKLGIPYENQNFEYFKLQGHASIKGFNYSVPGDFSSAAFPIVAALVTNSEITLHNIDMTDSQGDKEFISTLQKMGATMTIDQVHKTLKVNSGTTLFGVHVDINQTIDAITILAVAACYAEGETLIYNGAVAKEKECNRIASIATELRKMGAEINETADGLLIKGSSLKGANVHSYHDHRMAMSLAVAGLGASGETAISSVECVSKTFPTFFQDFKNLGAFIEESI